MPLFAFFLESKNLFFAFFIPLKPVFLIFEMVTLKCMCIRVKCRTDRFVQHIYLNDIIYWQGFVARDDIAIILINQHIAEMIRYTVDQHTASTPAVLEIPSKEAPYDPSKVRSWYNTIDVYDIRHG